MNSFWNLKSLWMSGCFYFNINGAVLTHLAVMTVSKYPVLLRRVEEQAQDVEVNGMLLKARSFIWTDENGALYFWVTKHHYLKYRKARRGIGY